MHRPFLLDDGLFRAPIAGEAPPTGAPALCGIALPPGARRARAPHYWLSDQPVDDAYDLAGRLAGRFSETGLWPLLWPFWDAVAFYVQDAPDLARIDEVGLGAELARLWAHTPRPPAALAPFGDEFPGLAPRMPRIPGGAPFDPFGLAADSDLFDEPSRLLLVPCTRPADAAGGLAIERTQPIPPLVETRLLRSFEDRFGAVPVIVTPGGTALAVERPPTGKMQAQRLAAELYLYAPRVRDQRPGALGERAAALRCGEACCWFLAR